MSDFRGSILVFWVEISAKVNFGFWTIERHTSFQRFFLYQIKSIDLFDPLTIRQSFYHFIHTQTYRFLSAAILL